MKDIAVIPGDGIGKEVISASLEVLEFLESKYKVSLDRDEFPFGAEHYLQTGEVLSDESLEFLKNYKTIFLGAVGSPNVMPGILEKDLLLKIRFSFQQYINYRPVRLYDGVQTPLADRKVINYVVIRENTGGLYTGIGGQAHKNSKNEVATQSMLYTYQDVCRCLLYAFKTAQKSPRKRLMLVGKSNVLVHVFDLWLRVFSELSGQFPDVMTAYNHVDAMCVHMIHSPDEFDVLVTTNMFGDIITDLAAVTQGGMGFALSANINPERHFPSMFEPVHGSAPDIAGKNKANPIATFLSLKELLAFLDHMELATSLEQAIMAVLKEGIQEQTTTEVTRSVISFLETME